MNCNHILLNNSQNGDDSPCVDSKVTLNYSINYNNIYGILLQLVRVFLFCVQFFLWSNFVYNSQLYI